LGPTHVLEIIIPKLEEILSILNINYHMVNFQEEKTNEKYSKSKIENNCKLVKPIVLNIY